jgi:uncharacterized metal-binding protein
MPAGRTHDAITCLFFTPVALAAWAVGRDPVGTAIAATSFAFAGLMFSGDLDLPSSQYRRWGPLRWVWLPYRWVIPHRSALSHGLFLGPAFRLAYLTVVAIGLGAVGMRLLTGRWQLPWAGIDLAMDAVVGLDARGMTWVAWALAGMWLGAASHSLADWGWSAIKSAFRRPRPRW